MTEFRTWSGEYYGRREGDHLIHRSGRCTGIFVGDEIYDADGRYLGEVRNGRLIRDDGKASKTGPKAPRIEQGALAGLAGLGGLDMPTGHSDFPQPR
jgi:hypothetical protein